MHLKEINQKILVEEGGDSYKIPNQGQAIETKQDITKKHKKILLSSGKSIKTNQQPENLRG